MDGKCGKIDDVLDGVICSFFLFLKRMVLNRAAKIFVRIPERRKPRFSSVFHLSFNVSNLKL